MKKTILFWMLIGVFFNAQVLEKFPKNQSPYKGGIIELYKDIQNIIVKNNLLPCKNAKELYFVKLLLTDEGKVKFIKDFDTINIAKNKCAYDLSLEYLKDLKETKKWKSAEVNGKKVSSIIDFYFFPDDFFKNYKENYNINEFYTHASYIKGEEKLKKDLQDNFMSLFYDYHVNGKFLLEFTINEDGRIITPEIKPDIQNETFMREFRRTLMRLDKKWNPALLHGIPIKSKMTIPLNFSTEFYEKRYR